MTSRSISLDVAPARLSSRACADIWRSARAAVSAANALSTTPSQRRRVSD